MTPDTPSTSPAPGRRNRRAAAYTGRLQRLPEAVRSLAEVAFAKFLEDPSHPSLRRKRLSDGSYSVRVGAHYRAMYFEDGDTNVWFFIGNHDDYEDAIGKG